MRIAKNESDAKSLVRRWNALSSTAAMPPDHLAPSADQQKWSSGEADPPSHKATAIRSNLPLGFLQLLADFGFLAANIAQMALEER